MYNTQNYLCRFGSQWPLVLVCVVIGSMMGCDQQRYKPAQWRPAARKSKSVNEVDATNIGQASSANWSTLPGRGAVWGTLPNRNGSTLPFRSGSTLPFRGGSTLPSRWSTLPNRNGMGTLPFRGGSTLPARGGFVPEQRWRKFPVRPMSTLPNRGGVPKSTLPNRRKVYEAISTSVPERRWETLPNRSDLRAGSSESSESNPLRK